MDTQSTVGGGLAERVAQLRSWNLKQNQDRLGYWKFAVERLRTAFELLVDDVVELHLRGPNLGTKSFTLAHYVTACLQKRQLLDGCPIPQWKGRVEAVQMVLDYKRMLLSVQPAYLKALEGWTFKARYFGEALSSLRIKPENGSDDESTWSIVHFLSQENKKAGVGIRADIVAFDEPPVIDILRELRKAGHANRRSIIVIAETPTIRREWAPLREDYGDAPRRSIKRVDKRRAEVRWSLDEVAPWVLSEARKQELREGYRNDPLYGEDGGARWHGDYTNTEGASPWGPLGAKALQEMWEKCTDPDMVTLRVQREATAEGEVVTLTKVPIQVWKAAERGKRYYLVVDPASGIDAIVNGTRHNPAAIHLSEQGSGELCVRWNGYLAPYSVGVLASMIARQYNDAVVDIEMKDHWGVNVFRGTQASGYGNIAHELRLLAPGQYGKEVGFDMNDECRSQVIGCIQEWLEAWTAKAPYAPCSSRQVIETIMDMELDERGKIVAGPGIAHAEDSVCRGRTLMKAVARHNRPMPQVQQPPKDANDLLLDKIRSNFNGQTQRVMPKPRARSRV